ncbi:MAG: ATP-binding protein [Termitinemataceae bacterium]|nr:MAG: ATP-binding protein [Termitinemataceae bacterium]
MNPFTYGSIVDGEDFFDRKDECAHIAKTLEGGNNMVLYAPRRFGKTSLVFQVMEELQKKNCTCIYFDFMPVYSPESFVRLYAGVLSTKQSSLTKFTQIFTQAIKSIRPTLGFNSDGIPEFSIDFANKTVDETVVGELLDMPEKICASGKRMIVFFDEFQECEKLSSINFEQLLRSKIQHQKNVNYLFLGSKTHLMNDLFNNKNRAFYNSTSQMTLGALPQNDTIAYLQKKFKTHNISIDPDTARTLIASAGDIPHYIQLLASEVWQYMIGSEKKVTEEIITDCAGRVLNLKTDYYMEVFDRQSQSKKQLLQTLTISGKNIFSASYIREHRLSSIAAIQRAAKELLLEGIIERTQDEYFFADPFFRLFVINTTKQSLAL